MVLQSPDLIPHRRLSPAEAFAVGLKHDLAAGLTPTLGQINRETQKRRKRPEFTVLTHTITCVHDSASWTR